MYYIITILTYIVLLLITMGNKKTENQSNNKNTLIVFLVLPLVSFVLAAIICLLLGIEIKSM